MPKTIRFDFESDDTDCECSDCLPYVIIDDDGDAHGMCSNCDEYIDVIVGDE